MISRFGAVHRPAGAARGAGGQPHRPRLPAQRRARRAGAAGRTPGDLGHPAVHGRPHGPAAAPVRRSPGRLGHAGSRTGRRCRPGRGARAARQRRWCPRGSTLVLVGDLSPAQDHRARSRRRCRAGRPDRTRWPSDSAPRRRSSATTCSPTTAPARCNRRSGCPAPPCPATIPAYPAHQLANLVYGGYFSSRLVENIREDKGYTYSARSSLEFWPGLAAVSVAFDTTTESTAPALLEARYELGRISLQAPKPEEIESARNYALGTLATSLSTQAGLASTLSMLAGAGLDETWLRDHPAKLAAVTVDEVGAAAASMLAPGAVHRGGGRRPGRARGPAAGPGQCGLRMTPTKDPVGGAVAVPSVPTPSATPSTFVIDDPAAVAGHRRPVRGPAGPGADRADVAGGPDADHGRQGSGRAGPRRRSAVGHRRGHERGRRSRRSVRCCWGRSTASTTGPCSARSPATPGGLREWGPLLSDGDAGLLTTATALLTWHAAAGFCPRCGQPSTPSRRRLVPDLPAGSRGLPAHRSGGDRPGPRRRGLDGACPATDLAGRPDVGAGRVRRGGGVARAHRRPRGAGGGRRARHRRQLPGVAAVAVPALADGRIRGQGGAGRAAVPHGTARSRTPAGSPGTRCAR